MEASTERTEGGMFLKLSVEAAIRIGVVALIMALNRWMVHEEEQPSVYETRGIIGL